MGCILSFTFLVSSVNRVFATSTPDVPKISGQVSSNTATLNFYSTKKGAVYEVSMSISNTSSYKVVYLGTLTSTTIKALTVGTPIFIKVRAFISVNSKKFYSSFASLSLTPTFLATSLKGMSSKGTNTLSWAKVTGATSYEVHVASSYSGLYRIVSSINTTTFSSKVGVKTKLYYKVRPYTTVNTTKVYGPFSNIVYLAS